MGKRSRKIDSVTEVVPQLAVSEEHAVASAIDRHQDRPDARLPILHEVQNAPGFIPEGAMTLIAAALHLTRGDVHGTDDSDWATNCAGYKVTAVPATRVTQPWDWRKRHRKFEWLQQSLAARGGGFLTVAT